MKPPEDRTSGKRPSPVGNAAGAPDARYAAVHADLDAIFASVAPTSPAPPAARVGTAGGRPSFGVRGMIVIGLLLVCAVLGLAWLRRPAPVVPAGTSARQADVAAAPRNAAPAAGASVATPAPDNDIAPVAPVPAPAEPAVVAATPSGRGSKGVAVAVPAGPARSAGPRHRAGRTGSRAAGERRELADTAAAPVACAPADSAWCLRDATIAADRDLRDAYEAALHAKVKGRTLRHVRREWVKYRRLANKKPKELIHGYTALTGDLHRAEAQKDGQTSPGRGR